MNVIEKYNQLIDSIEKYSKDKYLSIEQIVDEISYEFDLHPRQLAPIFKFFTGKTFSEYIRLRRMMLAYKYICENEEYNAMDATEIAGFKNQSSFNNAFRDTFFVSPKRVKSQNINDRYEGPLTWEELLKMKPEVITIAEKVPKKPKATIMGIEEDKFKLLRKIDNLSSIYGFSDYYANKAYTYANEHDCSLERTFAYFNEFPVYGTEKYKKEIGDDFGYKNEDEYYERFIKRKIEDPVFSYLHFKKGMADEYWTIKDRLSFLRIANVEDLTDTELLFLACEEMDARYCLKAAQYYDKHGEYFDEESIMEYLEMVCEYPTYEEAFEAFYPSQAFLEDVERTSLYDMKIGRPYNDDFSDIDAYMFEHHPDEFF